MTLFKKSTKFRKIAQMEKNRPNGEKSPNPVTLSAIAKSANASQLQYLSLFQILHSGAALFYRSPKCRKKKCRNHQNVDNTKPYIPT
jgi:hypothetical protein